MTDVRARTMPGARSGLRYLIYGFGLLLALLGASCGSNIFSVGTALITLHSKPGRFTSYVVTLSEIQLTRQDGNVIQLPFVNQRVDLANMGNFQNLMGAPPVEIGTYVAATIVLDYATVAPVVTVDSGGQAFSTTLYDDVTGVVPTTEVIEVKFDPAHPFVVADQKTQELNFNIDLEASNVIGAYTASTGAYTVTVKPFWNINAQPTYDKPVYARGLYVTTDKNNNKIVMNVRPLKDIIDSPFGAISANVNDQTYYNVNGVPYTGAAGLAAVASLQNVYAYLPMAVYGPPSGNPFSNEDKVEPSFTATQVYVGTSLESTIEDQMTGFISAVNPSTNTLEMQTAALFDHVGNLSFSQAVPITVGSGTIVSIDGNMSVTPNLSSISVGQVVAVLGPATERDPNNGDFTPVSFDATGTQLAGAQVRLQNTPIYGIQNSATANSLALNLLAIDRSEPTYVNFAGTGAGGAAADPTQYVVATTTDQSATPAGTVVKIDGMANTFGQGPPYFNASAVNNAVQAQLVIEWNATGGTKNGSLNPFPLVNGTGIVVNLADANLKASDGSHGNAFIRTGPVPYPAALQQPPYYYNLIGANAPPSGQLTILYNTQDAQHPPVFGVGSVSVGGYMDTSGQAYAADVQIVSNGALPIEKLVAYGQYDPTTGNFTATDITISAQ
jgi:hypothetical protein